MWFQHERLSCLELCDCQGDLMEVSSTCEWRGTWSRHHTLVFTPSVRGLMSPWERTEEAGLGEFLHVCLSVSPDMLWGRDDNRDVRGVQRPRSAANLPGHLARLTLFKQVPRRLVSCLVKWLTFWFNQHPRLPDGLDHYQKCTGSAMSLTCQNQTHLLIYLLHSPWEEHYNTVWA